MASNVLVTGAGGFIGSTLAEELVRAGYRVRAMVRYNSENRWGLLETLHKTILKEIDVFSGDIRDPHLVRKAVADCQIVFHLAALIAIPYSYQAPDSFIQTNVSGTLNIAQACLDHGVDRLVHTSTSETYGTAQYTPIDEKHPLVAQSPYTASKIGADKVVEAFYRSFGLPAITLRPFNTFGPRQSARAVIPTIISQILSGERTLQLGSLKPIREFNYVRDTTRGFTLAATASPKAVGQTINLGSGEALSIGDLLRLISDQCEVRVRVKTDPRRVRPVKSEVMELRCDSRKAKKLLGWKPQYDTRTGLQETIEWMRTNLHLYKPEVYNV
jgi:NAD dependent epimerase/dehydratase